MTRQSKNYLRHGKNKGLSPNHARTYMRSLCPLTSKILSRNTLRKPVGNGNISEAFRNTSLTSTPSFEKQSVNKVSQLFNLLASEFDEESEFYWCDSYVEDQINLIFEKFTKSNNPQNGIEWMDDILVNPRIDKFLNKLTLFRYDPFVQKS